MTEVSKPQIYVDMDDVLCETARGFTRLASEEFNREIAFEEIHSFHLGVSFRLSDEELSRFMIRAHEPDVLSGLTPVPGALDALRHWAAAGYEVAVVTGRPPKTQEITVDWLERMEAVYDRLVFADKYAHEEMRIDGRDALPFERLAETRFRIAIEDSATVGRRLAEELGFQVLLLDRPWNRQVDLTHTAGPEIVRCADWAEIMSRYASP